MEPEWWQGHIIMDCYYDEESYVAGTQLIDMWGRLRVERPSPSAGPEDPWQMLNLIIILKEKLSCKPEIRILDCTFPFGKVS